MVSSDVIRRSHKASVVVEESIVVHLGRYGGGSGRCGWTKRVRNAGEFAEFGGMWAGQR
jgi:hypothetical protein